MDTSSLLLRECENKMCFGAEHPEIFPIHYKQLGDSSIYECKLFACRDSFGSGLSQCSQRSCACLICCPFEMAMSCVDCATIDSHSGYSRMHNIYEWSLTTLCCCWCVICSG